MRTDKHSPLIPLGYKQTEVGVIPEDWAIGSLSRFWTVTDCKHVTAQFVDNGFPIASIKEVQSRFVDLTNAKQTIQQFYNLLIEGGRKPRVGDLILSRNATVGEVAQVAEWHLPFAMGRDVCLLRKKSPEFSTGYLQAVFRSPIIANQLSDLMVGSTFKRANVQQIKNFTVPMPPPSEQEAIAEALSDADVLIESLEQLIAKKRQIKQGAMQELLRPKAGWVEKRLGDVALFHKGKGLAKSELDPFGTEPCIHYGELFTKYPESIKRIHSRTNTRTGVFRSLANDVLMPTSDVTPNGLATASCILQDQVVLGGDILVIRALRDQLNGSFLSYMIRLSRDQIMQLVTGTTVFTTVHFFSAKW